MKSKGMVKGDRLLFVVLVIIGLSTFVYTQFVVPRQSKGTMVVVEIDGEIVDELNLNENAHNIRYETANGYNILEVQDGKVRITEADCPDLLCVHTGWRERVGQMIVCLPHRLIVKIVGEDESQAELDGFTY
ncbi:MAG: NusG domain II-containing protein [Firmicutes bacterium]|jgi:hypothetical protein|nr:NusG domain II-containing protein [Bacillota bacterium]